MTIQKGSDILLKDGTGTAATAIAALQTTGLKINGKSVDVTTRDSNGWQELLDGGGITNVQITAKGLVDGGTCVTVLSARALARSVNPYTGIFSNGDSLSGGFMLTSFELSGDYDKEQTYNLTLDSSGTITQGTV